MAVIEWVSGLQAGDYKQVYKNCLARDVFSRRTLEDVSIISRLISVVDHEIPSRAQGDANNGSWSTARRSRKRGYFLDNNIRSDGLLSGVGESVDGVKRKLGGLVGEWR